MNATANSTDFFNKLLSSKFNYWFGYVVNFSLIVWFASHAFTGTQSPVSLPEWVLWVVVGYVAWSAIEYLTHRHLYHAIARLGIGHNLHHESPTALLGVPWYITTLVLIGIFYALTFLVDPARLGAFMACAWFFYTAGCYLHHCMHRVNFRNPILRHLQEHHLIHHINPDVNFAVLMPFMDRVFFTGNHKPVTVKFPGANS